MIEKVYITWDEIEELVDILAQQIAQSGIQIEYIFGLQRGGLIPAVMLSHKLGIPMTQDPHFPNILIVDDICDSGETFKRWFTFNPEYTFACLHFKPHTSDFNPTFSSNKFLSDAWLVYPWEREDSKTIQDYKI
jgi:hypoxanthine phosphoribosyltransferase